MNQVLGYTPNELQIKQRLSFGYRHIVEELEDNLMEDTMVLNRAEGTNVSAHHARARS